MAAGAMRCCDRWLYVTVASSVNVDPSLPRSPRARMLLLLQEEEEEEEEEEEAGAIPCSCWS